MGVTPLAAPPLGPAERARGGRTVAVIDMGSNSFRLVVYAFVPGRWFRLVDEIRESVRLSEGVRDGVLQPAALARAGRAARLYAAYCTGAGVDVVDAVATSAARDARNQPEALEVLRAGGLPVRVLSEDEEARYGFLGAVNATTLSDGWFLDIGGGSMQVGRVRDRRLERSVSRPLGAVRLTEAHLTGEQRSRREARHLRRRVAAELAAMPWMGGGGRLVGVGGAIRTLAVMHQRATRHPFYDPQGHVLDRAALAGLVDDLLAVPAAQRARLPGLKPDRADIILAAALAVQEAMEQVGAETLEVCAHGLREGVMYEHYAGDGDPLLPDVRRASVYNAAERFAYEPAHAEHVAALALRLFDAWADLGLHGGDPAERELLWAAGILHDVGVLVDYSSHHRHGEYLVLNTGLPGFDHRELALVAILVRGHRKSAPSTEAYAPVLRAGDDAVVARGTAALRLAEQLDRARAGQVRDLHCRVEGGVLTIEVHADEPTLALLSAERERVYAERALGMPVRLVPGTGPGGDGLSRRRA